jgi:protein gp37
LSSNTGIEWCDATWNPVRGCSRVIAEGAKQSGCGDGTGGGCYAEAMAGRFCGPGQPYEGLVRATPKGPRWTGVVRMVPEHLADPLRWKKPRRIFVNSMSDLFHEALTNEQIAAVFGVMAAAPQHTFQVLTKRAERMRDWFRWVLDMGTEVIAVEAMSWLGGTYESAVRVVGNIGPWPLPNVWLGVSVENQAAADERIPLLRETPAALRFLSCEPLLGPVELDAPRCDSCEEVSDSVADDGATPWCSEHDNECSYGHWLGIDRVDWVIAGCESGRGARPAQVDWYRAMRDQCADAGVPFFLKQATRVAGEVEVYAPDNVEMRDTPDGARSKGGGVIGLPYLDGVQHAAFPVPR